MNLLLVPSTFGNSKCESCCLSKSHVLHFPIHYSLAAASFDVINTDVWGIAPHLSRLGQKYYVSFIDDHCRYTWIYFLKFKYEVFPIFQKFYNMVSTQFQKPIKIQCSDTAEKGIIHKKNYVLGHHNKMGLWKERIVTFQKQSKTVINRIPSSVL